MSVTILDTKLVSYGHILLINDVYQQNIFVSWTTFKSADAFISAKTWGILPKFINNHNICANQNAFNINITYNRLSITENLSSGTSNDHISTKNWHQLSKGMQATCDKIVIQVFHSQEDLQNIKTAE